MKKLALLSLAILCFSPLYARKTMLEMNLAKGDSFSSATTTNMVIKQQMMGMEMEMTFDMTFDMTSTVKEITDKGYLVGIGFDRAQVSMDMLGMAITVSSDDVADGDNSAPFMAPLVAYLKAITGKSFDVVMNKRGAAVEYVNLDKMLSDIMDDIRASLPEDKHQSLDNTLSQYFSPETLSQNIGGGKGFEYPAEAVKEGHKWTSEGQFVNNMMAMCVKSEYEFVGKKKGYWVVKVNSVVTTPENKAAAGPEMPLGLEMDLNGTMATEMRIDPKTGWFCESDGVQQISGHVNTDKVNVPMEIKTTSKMRTK